MADCCGDHVLNLALGCSKLESEVESPVTKDYHRTRDVFVYHVDDVEANDFAVL